MINHRTYISFLKGRNRQKNRHPSPSPSYIIILFQERLELGYPPSPSYIYNKLLKGMPLYNISLEQCSHKIKSANQLKK